MKKLLSLLVLMSLTILPGSVFAEQGAALTPEIVKVGNKICPVSGEKIGSMGEAYKVTHNGKEYNLCCEMCVKDFKKNPEKYAKIAEADAATHSDHADHSDREAEKKSAHEGHGDHGHHDHH